MSQPVSHFSLPGIVARVEGEAVKIEEGGKADIVVAISDVDAFCALLKAAAKNAKAEAVKIVGKPRVKKADAS